jgi:hypothetical protein
MSSTQVAPRNVPTFAGVMLLVLGAFNVLDGLWLIRRSNQFDDTAFHLSNADTWGWILIVFAVLQLVAGFRLTSGSGQGRTLALIVASVGMILWFGLLFAMPFAALIAIGINFTIIASVLSTE